MMYRSREDKDGTIVYVGGLLAEVKKEDIESEFEKFGKLLRVWVAFNPPGFAFVEFSNKEDAETAVNALHNATILGSKFLRVEISRGRGKGGRGGMSGRGGDRGRGGFRGGRGPEFSRGRGLGRGGFGGRPSPYDRNGDFRGRGGMGGRFNDYEDRRRPVFDDRDLGARRGMGGARDFGDIDQPRFGANRDIRDIGGLRGYGDRDIGRRDFPTRDMGGRDFETRDIGGIPPRDIGDRDFLPRNFNRDFGDGRDLRDFGVERDLNGVRGFGGNPRDALYSEGRELGVNRDFSVSQASIPGRDFGAPARDIGGGRNFGSRDIDDLRDYGGNRDIGMRRDPVRDFNQPRDIDNSREFGGGRSARVIDYADPDRFGAGGGRGGFSDRGGQRPGGFDSGRFSGGDIGGSGNYDGYDARDRFRSRSPIGRGSRPMY